MFGLRPGCIWNLSFFLKAFLCWFESVHTCAAWRWAGILGQFLHRISIFLSLPSRILLKLSFTYLYYVCTVCATGTVLGQNREIIKGNKSGILSILWPEVPFFPKPLAWQMWFLIGSLVECGCWHCWELTVMTGEGEKRKKARRDFPPHSPARLARKKRFLWALYPSMVPSP